MKRFNFLLTGILVVLLASCSQRTQITDSKPTVKIDTVLSAGGQTALQFPGRVKAAQDISLSFRVSGTLLRYRRALYRCVHHYCYRLYWLDYDIVFG